MSPIPLERLGEKAAIVAKRGFGYRDEYLYGEGHIRFAEVLSYETKELCNTDIYECMENIYGLKLPYSVDPSTEEECEENNEKIISFLTENFGTSDLYCKWVCSEIDDVINIYDSLRENISRWDINGNFIIVSDCGIDGVLVVSDNKLTET